MKKRVFMFIPAIGISLFFLFQCSEKKPDQETEKMEASLTGKTDFNGFGSQIKWGEHLVTIGACNDCHTPKKMTELGPVLDTARWLSGHPAGMPGIDIDRMEIQKKGLVLTAGLTEWIGPWGVSYAANLTPDGTGVGNWTEEQFFRAIREGRSKGIPSARTLLPPMPWDMYRHMTDEEIKAVFAYLRSIKPVNNLVPPPIPPGK
ncbi:MAG: diheme cytochrome c-553 [Cyclobacteriaceae bacterium]|nr:diheme cytochrome c-553 [Cyclobacteriaceae bacterium]